ncbi:MarR family winged helix-turn-helix transcriptional regulator [Pseudonocardia humida]|uniref:MarR family transcriptional regulator n=1 Tax=Pseudonocardia humida TaxID=2800819 RepID=A0ABT1AE77_9PSEU|nr:MarR family transcriptional regulator [Pseudonocardia humida]MCO1660964.1 MarR family transcriptional regulator [Pseudonocardia humida]
MPDTLAGDVGFRLARAGGAAIRNLNRALARHGLRSRQYTVLVAAAETPGRSQRGLGELLGVDPSAVVAIVDDLERDGLVRREAHPVDRRTRLVVATDAGRARLVEIAGSVGEVDAALLGDLDAGERATLLDLLGRLALD